MLTLALILSLNLTISLSLAIKSQTRNHDAFCSIHTWCFWNWISNINSNQPNRIADCQFSTSVDCSPLLSCDWPRPSFSRHNTACRWDCQCPSNVSLFSHFLKSQWSNSGQHQHRLMIKFKSVEVSDYHVTLCLCCHINDT